MQLKKFVEIAPRLSELKAVIVYTDNVGREEMEEAKNVVPTYTWNDFMKLGDGEKKAALSKELDTRMKKQKPGNVMTLIYTRFVYGHMTLSSLSFAICSDGMFAVVQRGTRRDVW